MSATIKQNAIEGITSYLLFKFTEFYKEPVDEPLVKEAAQRLVNAFIKKLQEKGLTISDRTDLGPLANSLYEENIEEVSQYLSGYRPIGEEGINFNLDDAITKTEEEIEKEKATDQALSSEYSTQEAATQAVTSQSCVKQEKATGQIEGITVSAQSRTVERSHVTSDSIIKKEMLQYAQEYNKTQGSDQTPEATVKDWIQNDFFEKNTEHGKNVNDKVHEAINQAHKDGSLKSLSPTTTDDRTTTYEHDSGSLSQERDDKGIVTFTPKRKFSGIVTIKRKDEHGYLMQEADVLEFHNGKLIAGSFATRGNPQIDIAQIKQQIKDRHTEIEYDGISVAATRHVEHRSTQPPHTLGGLPPPPSPKKSRYSTTSRTPN